MARFHDLIETRLIMKYTSTDFFKNFKRYQKVYQCSQPRVTTLIQLSMECVKDDYWKK